MDFAQLVLGQIPEAIYFALFLIFAKNLKEKRILFIFTMVFEYLLIKYAIHFNTWFQVLYTFLTYLTLKVFYKEKAQITDFVTFTIASILLILTSAICYAISLGNVVVATIINRIMIFVLLYVFRNKINKIENIYQKFWNRHNNAKAIKSVTFRSAFVVIFNVMFYIINIGMIIVAIYGK